MCAPGWLFSPPTNSSIYEIWNVWLKTRKKEVKQMKRESEIRNEEQAQQKVFK